MEKSMKEEWRPVRGFEDYAEISNLGQIHRFERVYYSGRNHKIKKVQEETWTYGSETSDGYLNAKITGITKGVHVWVYMTFNDCDIPKGYDVNHLDENPKNNRLDNLNLLSHGDNIRYGTGIERSAAAHRGKKLSPEHKAKLSAAMRGKPKSPEHIAKVAEAQRGKPKPKVAAALRGKYNTKKSKPVQALDKDGNVVYEFPSTMEAKRHGFHQGAVAACCRNCYNRPGNNVYKGYIWRFIENKSV